jgi:hypothetical protein
VVGEKAPPNIEQQPAIATLLAAQGAQLAFRGGTRTIINLWAPADSWANQPWNKVTTYSLGQLVTYFGKHYISDVNGNLNQLPGAPGSLQWSLAPNQPQAVTELDPQDGSPSLTYVPYTMPSGASMSYKSFNEAGFVSSTAVSITSGVAFNGPELGLLFFTGAQLPYITGTVG